MVQLIVGVKGEGKTKMGRMEGKKALEREPFCVGTGRAVNDGRTKMGPAACFFLALHGNLGDE